MEIIHAWAPPRSYGYFIKLFESTGIRSVKIVFGTLSSAPSTFDIELDVDSKFKTVKLVGPCEYVLHTSNCVCITRARFQSHLFGQNIEIKVYK